MSFKSKSTTLIKTVKHVKNWPIVVGQIFSKTTKENCQLTFRNGLNVIYRPETEDWEVVKEVMLYGVYGACMEYLASQTEDLPVLDLGANIGLFSLQAAHTKTGVEVHAYEPAPRNLQLISANLQANPNLLPHVHIHAEAAGGSTRTASFFYDEKVPQGSSLFTNNPERNFSVTVRSLEEIADRISRPLGMVKIDVEGAEYEIIQQTPPKVWKNVRAISIEIHEDPSGKLQKKEILALIESLGYRGIKEKAGDGSYFFHRGAQSHE